MDIAKQRLNENIEQLFIWFRENPNAKLSKWQREFLLDVINKLFKVENLAEINVDDQLNGLKIIRPLKLIGHRIFLSMYDHIWYWGIWVKDYPDFKITDSKERVRLEYLLKRMSSAEIGTAEELKAQEAGCIEEIEDDE